MENEGNTSEGGDAEDDSEEEWSDGDRGEIWRAESEDDDDAGGAERLSQEERPQLHTQPAAVAPAEGTETARTPKIETEDGADLPGYVLTEADRRLNEVYGDHPHRNDGTHLDGGIADDRKWQERWRRIAQLNTSMYDLPLGARRLGRRFVKTLAEELKGVRDRKWNSERPLVFAAVVLQRGAEVKGMGNIKRRIEQRMKFWEEGRYVSLVDDVEAEIAKKQSSGSAQSEESKARAFNAKVLSGRLRQAVRHLTDRGGGGVIDPDGECTKAGRPVTQVLEEKHPDMREPDLTDPEGGAFEPYKETPFAVPLVVSEEMVEKVASRMGGGAGPGGADAVHLQNWLLRFGAESERLRLEVAEWVEWLANSHPPWAAYRAMMACRLVALDKQPGTRPVGIGEVYRRLMAKILLLVVGHQATVACSNFNLCAGLPAGIEGAVHAVQEFWDGAHQRDEPAPFATQETGYNPPAELVDRGVFEVPDPAEAELHTQPDPAVPAELLNYDTDSDEDDERGNRMEDGARTGVTGVLLVDARNGFNELGRKAMLWTVRHRWAAGAKFAFNCYRHSAQLIMRRGDRPCHVILSKEGVTQGDPLSMVLYGITLVPLAERLRKAHPTVLQPWYADDMAMAGPVEDIAGAMEHLQRWGPARGYFPEPSKSIMICSPEHHEVLEERMGAKGLHFKYSVGHRYIGGFIGSEDARREWVEEQVEQWTEGVDVLARVAHRFPQTAYAGLAKSLQHEWQYLQRVTPAVAESFAPIEEALAEGFLPALLKESVEGVAKLRELLALPVRMAGLGVPNPTVTADACYRASLSCTETLTKSLTNRDVLDAAQYSGRVRSERYNLRVMRTGEAKVAFERIRKAAAPKEQKRMLRAQEGGQWLNVLPSTFNGTQLSQEEFTDSVRLRFGLQPLALPAKCDGCHQAFSVEHAMQCKKGGLITLRHNDISSTWRDLNICAFPQSAVADEPLILKGQANGCNGTGRDVQPDIRGDVSVHGFWRRGTTAIFDIRVTDTESPTYRSMEPGKVLEKHEKEKKGKYLDACLARRRHFTPLVFSVDGMAGAEAVAASKRLAGHLAESWGRQYSEVCGYVRSRLSVALVRTASMCLRGTRDPTAYRPTATYVSGAGLSLYR